MFIDFDRFSDSETSLKMFVIAIEHTDNDSHFWKYCLLSIHNALQGYMCIALSEGNSFATWKEQDFKKWMKAYENGEPLPETKLDYFMSLFEKLKIGANTEISACGVSLKGEMVKTAIEKLNNLRNAFSHFNVDGRSITQLEAAEACIAGLATIKHIVDDPDRILWYEDSIKEECQNLIKDIENRLGTTYQRLNKQM